MSKAIRGSRSKIHHSAPPHHPHALLPLLLHSPLRQTFLLNTRVLRKLNEVIASSQRSESPQHPITHEAVRASPNLTLSFDPCRYATHIIVIIIAGAAAMYASSPRR